jgi:Family of unknown function (DUF6496)
MRKETPGQKGTIRRVMHEYKYGELRSGVGKEVRNPKQAIAIALREAGASSQESTQKNADSLRRSKAKEHRGETAEAEADGREAQDRTLRESGRNGGK